MKLDQYNNFYDHAAPTEEQKARMLNQILSNKGAYSTMRQTKKTTIIPRLVAAVGTLCLVCVLCFQLLGSSPLILQVCAAEDGTALTSDMSLQGGRINNDGTGDNVLFYITGEDIAKIQFTCENQYLTFKDWTEQRENFWRQQSFVVEYGSEESDYSKLVYYWDPYDTYSMLEEKGVSITDLPQHLREDTITIAATYENGQTLVQNLSIRVLDDGTTAITLAS